MSDSISRQYAIKRFGEDGTWLERQGVTTLSLVEAKQRAVDLLESFPSAEPKTGKWIEVEVLPEVYDIEGVKSWGSKMQCDQCGFIFTAIEGHITQYNFCPNCGAKMGGDTT